MSQPDVAYGFRSADGESPSIDDLSASLDVAALCADEAILREFDPSLSHESLVARIVQLEQALDQALACIRELRLSLRNQGILEAQLARTEEFSHAQQLAIARLKQQLSEHHQTLDAQQSEARTREQTVQELLTISQAQREELELLRNCLSTAGEEGADPVQDHVQALTQALDLRQQRVIELETDLWHARETIQALEQQVQTANQEIQELTTSAQHQQTSLIELETQLEHAYASLAHQQNLILTLRQTQAVAAERNTTIAALQKDLAIAQMKVGELETQLAKESRLQASWKQRFKELESDCDRQQISQQALRQENAELQEQVFQQADSAKEYEAAVQHWKERHFATQHCLSELKALCALVQQSENLDEKLSIPVTPALLQLLSRVEALELDETTAPDPDILTPTPRPLLLELPEFLLRRRSYRPR